MSLALPVSVEAATNSVRRQAKYAAKLSFCFVCGDKARIVNYGALSCSSCKTFFRRHGFRIEKVDPCRFNGDCEVRLRARRICTACRLAKCLSVGMSPDLIRKDLTERNCCSSEKPKQRKMSTALHPLNLLNGDRSNLSSMDWTLISNIIQAYDILSPIQSTRHELVRQAKLPLKLRSKIAQDFIPNLVISFYTSLQSYVKCTHEFRALTADEQMSLCQRNFHSISSFTGQLILRESGLFDHPPYMYAFASLYDSDTLIRAGLILKRLDYDSTLVKIFLIIVSFSSNCFLLPTDEKYPSDFLLTKTKVLYRYQNLYADLLWKYMIYRYGYEQAAHRFLGLIKQILDLIPLAVETFVQNTTHQSMVNDINEKRQS